MILEHVRVNWVHVIEPKENLSGTLKYSIQVIINKDDKDNLARVNNGIDSAIKKGMNSIWGGKKPKFRYEPLRDGNAELAAGDLTGNEYKDTYFFNATMDPKYGKPGVVDENLKPIMNADKIYSGCYCNLEVNAFPYDNSGSRGIAWGLNNVMFVEDGDRLDGRQSAQDAFANLAPQSNEEAQSDAF